MSNSQSTRVVEYASQLVIGDSLALPSSTVTQLTSVTTGVTINAASGVITTFSQSAAANTTASFTVTNSAVKSTDKILVSLNNYAGTYATNGIPVVAAGTVADGSFVIRVSNAHAANALSGAVKIAFAILR